MSTPQDADGTEPTQPVGYWERRANEQAAEQARQQGGQPYPTTPYPQGGPVFNPTSAQALPAAAAAGTASAATSGLRTGIPGWPARTARTRTARVPTASPGRRRTAGSRRVRRRASQAPGQPAPYVPMSPYGGFVAPPPDHPQSTLSLVLGLVGVIGAFILCGVPLVVSPFAWAIGHSALKEIRASQGRLGGESHARTGMILGIIGTVLPDPHRALHHLSPSSWLPSSESSTTSGSSV